METSGFFLQSKNIFRWEQNYFRNLMQFNCTRQACLRHNQAHKALPASTPGKGDSAASNLVLAHVKYYMNDMYSTVHNSSKLMLNGGQQHQVFVGRMKALLSRDKCRMKNSQFLIFNSRRAHAWRVQLNCIKYRQHFCVKMVGTFECRYLSLIKTSFRNTDTVSKYPISTTNKHPKTFNHKNAMIS